MRLKKKDLVKLNFKNTEIVQIITIDKIEPNIAVRFNSGVVWITKGHILRKANKKEKLEWLAGRI